MAISNNTIKSIVPSKIFSFAHFYDISLLLGSYFFGIPLSRKLFGPIMGTTSTDSTAIMLFYLIAIPLYFAGLFLYMKPLANCTAVTGIQKPKFTQGDQASLVFSSCIFGIFTALLCATHCTACAAYQMALPLLITAAFTIAGLIFFLVHHRAMKAAGTGSGMRRHSYYIMMIAGYMLMYPLIVGIFSPVDALRMTLDIRLDSAPATGFFDVILKAGMRSLLLSCIAWMLVYTFRRIASVPFGVRANSWRFFVELAVYNTTLLILQYYGLK